MQSLIDSVWALEGISGVGLTTKNFLLGLHHSWKGRVCPKHSTVLAAVSFSLSVDQREDRSKVLRIQRSLPFSLQHSEMKSGKENSKFFSMEKNW